MNPEVFFSCNTWLYQGLFSASFAARYLYWLKNYICTGRLPAVVNFFRDHKDYTEVRRIQKEIVQQYQGDFGKHIRAGELRRINMVRESIPMQLAKENKKFFFGQIKKGARSTEFETAIQWLADAGLVHKVNRVNEPHIPLSAYKDFSAYKLFVLDIGILGHSAILTPVQFWTGTISLRNSGELLRSSMCFRR